jgi:hypothetical protein
MHHSSAARTRRALLGVALGVACLAGTAGAARADTGPGAPSVIEFTVPDRAAIDRLNTLGYDLTEYTRPNADGTLTIDVEVTPQQADDLVAMGYPEGQTVETPAHDAEVSAHADATARQIADAYANLNAGHAVRRAAAAASDTVLASRADYFENYAGRYLSVEARPSDPSNVAASNPTLTAAWDSGPGTAIGGAGRQGTLTPFIDRSDASYYLYHFNTFRVGDLNDGKGIPTTVRVASSNGGVDTIPVKRWTSANGTGFSPGYLKDFTTDYTDPQAAYKKIRDLSAEFSNISQIYDLPYKTNGYQRHSQWILGTTTPYDGGTVASQNRPTQPPPSIRVADRGQAVVLTSKAWGQDGGNGITAEFKDPLAANAPLGVAVTGSAITVNLATDATGKITSTAAQIVSALNADPAASALVSAETYRSNAGGDPVVATPVTPLTDFLHAPASYPRGPQTLQMIRIGAHRDGSRTGVLLYCEEHAREWATSLTCLETAERLLRNYGTDPEDTSLVDNLDIFIIPVVNADGTAYSRYDFTSQRRNMTNYCANDPNNNDPVARNTWGVDINRDFSVGSFFDGYFGASNSCTSDVFAGPSELSQPEAQDEVWVQSTFKNIKFANNIHSYGGYFMWPPGAYTNTGRVTLPYASTGTNQFFDQTAATTLERIQNYRHTTVLPARTGPVADVLYSAAGNSADEAYYNNQDRSDGTKGIIGYDFEIGVDRFVPGNCSAPGDTVDMNPQAGCVAPVGFTPTYNNEGHDEAMEFANGNIGLLTAALAYENDHTPPDVKAVVTPNPNSGLDLTFTQSEPADIYYTTDGSTPTTSSPTWAPAGPRQRLQPIHLAGPVPIRYMAVDIKGQRSAVQSYVYSTGTSGGVSGSVPATLALSLASAPSFGAFTPGVGMNYTAGGTANVVSTAGDATLSVADPGTTAPGHLVNGAYSLPSALQAAATSPGGTGAPTATVSGAPATLETWTAPVSNDPVALTFTQHIGQNDALRTGSYSKTLTFTLSTTNP